MALSPGQSRSINQKYNLWENQIENNVYESFLTLLKFIVTFEDIVPLKIIDNLIVHLKQLTKIFKLYFPPLKSEDDWIRKTFHCQEIHEVKTLTFSEQEQLTGLSTTFP